jgi:hypothetical protein
LILKRWIPGAGAAVSIALAGLLVAQGAKEKELFVVTHVDVGPNTAVETAKAVAQLAMETRKDAGCIRFDGMCCKQLRAFW